MSIIYTTIKAIRDMRRKNWVYSQELQNLKSALDHIDYIAEEDFHTILSNTMMIALILDTEIVIKFDISKQCLLDWKIGNSVPNSSIRKNVFEYLKERLERRGL